MKKKRLLSCFLTLAYILVLCGSLSAWGAALQLYTVRFYRDSNKTSVYATQQVTQGGHPVKPAAPASYQDKGFRYVCSGWYWTVDGSAMAFSFTDEDCEIWSDTELYAGYTQYLAPGYRLVVVHAGGQEHITDTNTPVPTILRGYSDIIRVYPEKVNDPCSSGHTPGAAVTENLIPSTCTKTGSYSSVVYCEVCHKQLACTKHTIKKKSHTWDSGTVTKAPTYTATGTRTFRCTVCGAQNRVSIPKLARQPNPLRLRISHFTCLQKNLKLALHFQIGASGKGAITYTLDAKAKAARITVSRNGTVTLPKKCKKGTYQITVRAGGSSSYREERRVVIIKVN